MNEYFESKVTIFNAMSEEEITNHKSVYGKEPDLEKEVMPAIVSLEGIVSMFPTEKGVVKINYDCGHEIWLNDSYERVKGLHSDYIKNRDKNILIKGQ